MTEIIAVVILSFVGALIFAAAFSDRKPIKQKAYKMSRKYQVWVASFAVCDGPRIVFESATLDRAEEIAENFTKDYFEPWLTYTESENPNEYIKVDV